MHYNQTEFLRKIRLLILSTSIGRAIVIRKYKGQDSVYALLNFSRQVDVDFFTKHYSPEKYDYNDPVRFYVEKGTSLNLDPAPWFNTRKYQQAHSDQLSEDENPFLHYLFTGKKKGYTIEPTTVHTERSYYQQWIDTYDTLQASDLQWMTTNLDSFVHKPLLSVIVPVYNPPVNFLRRAIESVINQTYPYWELCIADDNSTDPEVITLLQHYAQHDPRIKVIFRKENGHISECSNSCLSLATGEYCVLFDHDDLLPAHALFMVADAINRHPSACLLYSDEDKIDENDARYDPYFKTDFNHDLFYSQNFISHLGTYKTEIVRKAGGFRKGYEGSQDYDLALRVTEQIPENDIVHIPHVLYHWRAIPGSTAHSIDSKSYALTAGQRALQDHFHRQYQHAEVSIALTTQYRVTWTLASTPKVSIIIPFHDHPALLKNCVRSILDKTTYKNYELVLMNNNSALEETKMLLQGWSSDPRIRIFDYPEKFNFSAINNKAVGYCTGSVILFLNNDTEVISPEWLTEMVSHVMREHVGAVGAKLYYDDDAVQHAGVIIGMGGIAGHVFKGLHRNNTGPFGRASLTQNYSAVTAACLCIRKSVFEQTGGFDESNLRVAFNDVDLCLKIRRLGYRIVFTPFAELYHYESKSRGSDFTAERIDEFKREVDFMRRTWAQEIAHDPYYNPNLSFLDTNFSFSSPPRIAYPWQELMSVPAMGAAFDLTNTAINQTEEDKNRRIKELEFELAEKSKTIRLYWEQIQAMRIISRIKDILKKLVSFTKQKNLDPWYVTPKQARNTQRFRITIITPSTNLHGGTKRLLSLTKHLVNRNHSVTLIQQNESKFLDWFDLPIPVVTYPFSDTTPLEELERNLPDADILLSYGNNIANPVLNNVSRKKGSKFCLFLGFGAHDLQLDVSNAILPNFRLLTVSSWISAEIKKHTRRNSTCIGFGVHSDQFYPVSTVTRELKIGTQFHKEEKKRSADAIAAYFILKEKYPSLKLMMFGQELNPALDPEIEYHYNPPQEKLRELYCSCQAWVMPSISEGTGMCSVEAMLCKTPLITVDSGGSIDFCNSSNSTFVPRMSPKDIANAADWIFSHPEKAKRMAHRAHRDISKHTWSKSIDKLQAAFIHAVGRSKYI